MITLEEFVRSNKQFVVAHRGNSVDAPENTIAAFKSAIEIGAMMIETDIQFTSDGSIISFHDFYLDRTTNSEGLVCETNVGEIKKLDAGGWFDEKFKNEKIPTLSETIETIRDKIYLNIEIKNYTRVDRKESVKNITELIKALGYDKKTLFSSFDHDLLKEIKLLDSSLHTAVINIPGDTRLPSLLSEVTGCEAFVCSVNEINRKLSDDAENNGLFIGVYPIDTIEEYNLIKDYNIKAYVSNNPLMLINHMKSVGKL